MLVPKNVSLLLAATLVASLIALLAIGYSQGKSNAAVGSVRVKVLRRKDQINQKPTAAEIESSKNGTLETTPTQQAERELEDQIPKHLPIKIKIKADKERAFKNLQNEDWHRDLELEIRNTGDKPIYYIDLLMVFPDVLDSAGNKTG